LIPAGSPHNSPGLSLVQPRIQRGGIVHRARIQCDDGVECGIACFKPGKRRRDDFADGDLPRRYQLP
jgi:hypothetical protein